MIAANEAVASTLEAGGYPALFRVHEEPSKASRAFEIAPALSPARLGIPMPPKGEPLHPRHLQPALDEAPGTPAGARHHPRPAHPQRAVYSPDCIGHFALASGFYTHFTSPIRRYPDLVVHRRLKAFIAPPRRGAGGAAVADPGACPASPHHASTTERRAEQSERDLLQWKKVRFLAGRVGEMFTGSITGVQPFGLFVALDEYHVDGLVPIRSHARRLLRLRARRPPLGGLQPWPGVPPGWTRWRCGWPASRWRHRGLDLEIAPILPGTRAPRRGRGRRR